MAIANVLLLRGYLSLDKVVEPLGYVSAFNLMQLVRRRLIDTNPPLTNTSELQRLTQEKTLEDVAELLPTMLVGLDVNVRFHRITDFEYTVVCAAFDMLDIVMVHGWLLDEQDEKTMKVVGNKSYNELIERLVDYRALLMAEEANAKQAAEFSSLDTAVRQDGDEGAEVALQLSPLATQTIGFETLSIDANSTHATSTSNCVQSPHSVMSQTSPTKSPSQQTVETMMKERHISDADALDTANTLLEEGPILEEFFNLTANQLTYYGLVRLHEGIRERQLCVFFRNNHFSTLFKFGGALYLLVTDAGYLDESTVVWELLDEIDGDTAFLDAQFHSVTSSEQQQKIFTHQKQLREPMESEEQHLRKSREVTLSGGSSPLCGRELVTNNDNAATAAKRNSGLYEKEVSEYVDDDYLLALTFQREEEELSRGSRSILPSASRHSLQLDKGNCDISSTKVPARVKGDESRFTNESESLSSAAYRQAIHMSEEELELQRQTERNYQEKKWQEDALTRQYHQEQERLRKQQRVRGGQRRTSSELANCIIT